MLPKHGVHDVVSPLGEASRGHGLVECNLAAVEVGVCVCGGRALTTNFAVEWD